MKKFTKILLLVIAVAITSGCARTVVVSEVLQMQLDDKLYTKYNIWYTEADNINCLNIQQGTILPIGTEVEIIECDEKKVTFAPVATGEQFTIKLDRGERMCNMQEFVQMTFTVQPLDKLLADVSAEAAANIKKAVITEGMTKKEIELAYGPVPPIFTPDKRNITWMYPIKENRYLRLIFHGNKLKTILNLYENAE